MWLRPATSLSLSIATVFTLAFTAAAAPLGQSGNAPTAADAPAGQITSVVELFTSQGCSSCPKADALLETYAKQPGVLALTFSIDYWDYLGWKDTLASPRFSHRQRGYAKARGDGMVYTPQVVVNGLTHVNGSRQNEIDAAIEATNRQFASHRVGVHTSADNDQFVITVDAAAPGIDRKNGTVWLLRIQQKTEVSVTRGENTGKTLAYFNVVREMSPVGMWTGEAATMRLDRKMLANLSVGSANADVCAVLVQLSPGGPIVGAAKARAC